MRITKVAPVKGDPDPSKGIEVSAGEFQEAENDWYQADLASLKAQLAAEGIGYRECHLMRKAVGFESGLLIALLIWAGTEALKVLAAWLPAREGRKVKIKFMDGTEIEATTVNELEQIRDKFLSQYSERDANED